MTEDEEALARIVYEGAEKGIDEAMKGIHFVPEELRRPILLANKAYIEIAEEREVT